VIYLRSGRNRISDFRHKEVIDITSGIRLGYISDVDIDLEKGLVNSIIIPGRRRFFGFLPAKEDIIIEWRKIAKIGDDIILVTTDAPPPEP